MSRLPHQVREAVRTRRYSLRAGEAYLRRVRQHTLFFEKYHPAELSAKDVCAFLSHLALDRQVSTSTQTRATLGPALPLPRGARPAHRMGRRRGAGEEAEAPARRLDPRGVRGVLSHLREGFCARVWTCPTSPSPRFVSTPRRTGSGAGRTSSRPGTGRVRPAHGAREAPPHRGDDQAEGREGGGQAEPPLHLDSSFLKLCEGLNLQF